jgi:WD40 repeat protein
VVKSWIRGAATARELSPDGLHTLKTYPDHAWVEDANTGKTESVLNRNAAVDFVNSNFSPDGTLVFTTDAQFNVHVWLAIKSKELAELAGHQDYINKMTISHNRKWILTASDDHTARVWDLVSGKCLLQLIGHTHEVWDAQFSPDDKYVLTSSVDGTIRVWNSETGRTVYRLSDPLGDFMKAVFSPDGSLIATTGSDNTIKVRDARTGNLISELLGHTRKINEIVFSPDGRFIATASNDGTARIYPREMFIPIAQNLKLASLRLTRDLTLDERKKYLHLATKGGR